MIQIISERKNIFFLLTFLLINICCTGITYAETSNNTSEVISEQITYETSDDIYNDTSDVNYQLIDNSPDFSNIHGYFVNCRVTSPNNLNTTTLINQGITDLFVLTYRDDPEGSLVPFLNKFAGTGIRIHAWVSAFKDFDGNSFYPEDNPELLNQIITAITSIATNYNIDGINLDYIRYPGNAYLHPGAVDYVNSFCETIYNNIQAINNQQILGKPQIKISADLMPECSVNAYYYGQDYPSMSNYLDFLMPMVYKGNYHQDTSWIGRVMNYIVAHSNEKPVVAALQTYRSDWDYTRLPADEMVLDIKTAIDHGSSGYALFRYGMVNSEFPGNSIQHYIDISAPGDTVVIHSINGNPTIYDENIVIDKSIILKSADNDTIIINALDSNLPVVTVINEGDGSTIQGFLIIDATNSSGIRLESADNCSITGNMIISNSVGVNLYNSNNNTISSNFISNNGWAGICLDASSENTINGSNYVTSNQDGIFLVNNSNNNHISANSIYDNTGIGVSIINSSTSNTLDANMVRDNGVMGVFIQNSNTNTLSGNTMQNNVWTGICLDHASENIIDNGNMVNGNGEGIFLANASVDNNISGNNIYNNSGAGISFLSQSNNNQITSNIISNNGVTGVFIQNSNNNTLIGNTIQNNTWSGVCLDQATGNSIINANTVTGNQEGIFMANNSLNNTISGNTINNNTGNGISALNSNTNIIATNSQINNNGVSGIFVQNSNGTIIHHNTLNSNDWGGVILDISTNTQVYNNNFNTNPEQALAVNGTGNAFYQGTSGNYWSDWPYTNPRPIDGNEGLHDQYPSLIPF